MVLVSAQGRGRYISAIGRRVQSLSLESAAVEKGGGGGGGGVYYAVYSLPALESASWRRRGAQGCV